MSRKAAEEFLLTFMGEITKGKANQRIYAELFKNMNDQQFFEFVDRIEKGLENKQSVPIWASNTDKNEDINFDNIIKLAKKYGVVLETQLIITDEATGIEFITPKTSYVGITEFRKQRQMLQKKFGAGKDDNTIDDLTGQVVGESKGGGISNPENQILKTLGLIVTGQELNDVRGGDLKALDAYKNELITTGSASVYQSLRKGGGVKSMKTLHYLLRQRFIDNNLNTR